MPPRSEIRRSPHRASRSPLQPSPINDATLWPDEGSDTDPESVPSDTESDATETESEYDTESSDDDEETDYDDSDSD